MPLTPETKGSFNAKSLAEMKDDAVVLNTASRAASSMSRTCTRP
ncbi:MAG: NAD(P)-dependent oxidoreductase [Lawsonibacter sp.]